jgi:VIT family
MYFCLLSPADAGPPLPIRSRKLAARIILILGGASVIAGGFAMAAANYLATRAEHEEFDYAEAVERRHIETVPDGEREEVREILRGLGLLDELLDRVVAVITADRDRRSEKSMVDRELVAFRAQYSGDWWRRRRCSVHNRRLAAPSHRMTTPLIVLSTFLSEIAQENTAC